MPHAVRLTPLLLLLPPSQVMRRLVRPFDCYPWRLANLARPDLSLVQKQLVATEFLALAACDLDPFSKWIKSCFSGVGVAGLASPDGIRFVTRVFSHIPTNNLHSEFRFASQRRHAEVSHGQSCQASTLCSNHVLDEAKMCHDVAMKSFGLSSFAVFHGPMLSCPGSLSSFINIDRHHPF